jgi:hypothetical protein
MGDAEHKLRLAECAIKKPRMTADDEVVADESMTNVQGETYTEAEAVKENEMREHEYARVEAEHERERKMYADADSFMARHFYRAGASIVNKDGIMQIHGSKGSRMFRAATGQAESEHMQNEKRRVQELHEMVPVVETECSRKMAISRLATLFETKLAEVKQDASEGGMSGYAICEKIVVDNLFKALSNVIEFKADEAVNKEWRAHSEKVPLVFQDCVNVARKWGNVMPHAELTLENDVMPADVSAVSEDRIKVLEAEVQSLRSANNALRAKMKKQGAGSRPFQKKTETKKTKAPCRRHFDTTIDECTFGQKGTCRYSHEEPPMPTEMKELEKEGLKQGRKVVRKLEGATMTVAAITAEGDDDSDDTVELNDSEGISDSEDEAANDILQEAEEAASDHTETGAIQAVEAQGQPAPTKKAASALSRLGTRGNSWTPQLVPEKSRKFWQTAYETENPEHARAAEEQRKKRRCEGKSIPDPRTNHQQCDVGLEGTTKGGVAGTAKNGRARAARVIKHAPLQKSGMKRGIHKRKRAESDTNVVCTPKTRMVQVTPLSKGEMSWMRDSGSQRHIVPRREHMYASRKTRPNEGHYTSYNGQSEQAKRIGTVKIYNPRAGLVVTLSNTLQSEGRTPIINDNLFQDEAKLRIMREPGGVAIYKTTCGLEWPCVKGKGGHEFLRGVPVTRGDTGIGIDVKALPRDVQQLDMTTGEYGYMFRQSQQKPGEMFSVTHVGESSWRGSPRDSIHEGGKKVTVEKATKQGLAKALVKAETADVVFGWLPRLELRSLKRYMAKMWLARRQIYTLDRKEMTEMQYLHHAMGHCNWRRLAQYVKRANIEIKGPRDKAFCDACAVTKITKNPVKKQGEQRNTIGAAVRKAGGSLWEYCSYDVAGKFATPAVNGGGQYEFHAVCHITSTHYVAGFAQPRDLYTVMEDFLATAAAQRQAQEMERGINLMIDTPEGHRTKKYTKIKSDFFSMHRSQRMKTIMHKHGRTQIHTAPEEHHKMGKQERFMRTVHEAANAMMEAANLPPKYRLEAVKAAVRCNDYLGTKGNPEEYSPRSMRAVLAGKVDPRDVFQQMIPAVPYGVPAYAKKFNAGKEERRSRGAAVYCGYDEPTRSHKIYYDQVQGCKKDYMQYTPHVEFDLSLPPRVANHGTIVVGSDGDGVQPQYDTAIRKYTEPPTTGDQYEVENGVVEESTVITLARPEIEDVGVRKVNDEPEECGKNTEKESESEGEAEQIDEGEAPGNAKEGEVEDETQEPKESMASEGTGYEYVEGENGETIEIVNVGALSAYGWITTACRQRLEQEEQGGRRARKRAEESTEPMVAPVIGEVYKNWEKAKQHVISIENPAERQKSWDMLMKGHLKEYNKMERQNVMEPVMWGQIPKEHRDNGWVLRSLMQYHQKGDENNQVSEWKSRWCIDGSTCIEGIHTNGTSSPTPRPESIRAIAAEAAMQLKEGDTSAGLRQGDLPSAYTHWDQPAELEVYFRAPKGQRPTAKIDDGKGGIKTEEICFKLRKACYGMPSSGLIHYKGLRAFLEDKIGMITGEHDKATWTFGMKQEEKGGAEPEHTASPADKSQEGKKGQVGKADQKGKAKSAETRISQVGKAGQEGKAKSAEARISQVGKVGQEGKAESAETRKGQAGKASREGKAGKEYVKALGSKSKKKGEPAWQTENEKVRMAVWVDDVLYHCRCQATREKIERAFEEEFGDCGWKDATFFAGLNIEVTCAKDTPDKGKWGVKITARTLTELIHEKHAVKGMLRPKDRETPAPDGWVASQAEMAERVEQFAKPFVRLVGALAFVAQNVRLDAAFTTAQYQRVQARPGEKQYKLLTARTLEYMYRTRDRGLFYRKGDYEVQLQPGEVRKYKDTEMVAFSDSSHADVEGVCPCEKCYKVHKIKYEDNGHLKSTKAMVMVYAGAPISWRSATGMRHDSTTKSELEAATDATTRIPLIKGILQDFGHVQGRTDVMVDNSAVVFICHKEFSSKRCQYVIKKQLLCRDAHNAKDGAIEACNITSIWTETNFADILTKSLPARQHRLFCQQWMHDDGQDEPDAKKIREELCEAVEAYRRVKYAERRAKCAANKYQRQNVNAVKENETATNLVVEDLMSLIKEFEDVTREAGEKVRLENGKPWRLKAKIQKKLRKLKNGAKKLKS